MSNPAERVGPAFSVKGMEEARAETRRAIAAIAGSVRPGMVEEDAVRMAKEVIRSQGHALSWHPTRVRFGKNMMKPMKKESEPGVVLGANDIFFIDIAPRVDHWEGDGGASFIVGEAPDLARCAADAEKLFHEVRAVRRDRKWTGDQLYDFAARRARDGLEPESGAARPPRIGFPACDHPYRIARRLPAEPVEHALDPGNPSDRSGGAFRRLFRRHAA
jgi:methionyl aminopeptidase